VSYTVFTLLRSDVNKSTGEITWSRLFELTPANITNVTIKTESYDELIEHSGEPEIIPYGVGSCVASVTGTFFDPLTGKGSFIQPTTNLSLEVTNFDDTIKLFDEDIDNENVIYAIRLGKQNQGGCRELEEGIWKIKKFKWDRTAKEMGKYRFNMDLAYFWADPSEQQLYSSTTGSKKVQDVRFQIDIYETDNGQLPATGVNIFDVEIHKSLFVKNTARFSCDSNIFKNSYIIVKLANAIKDSEKYIFIGIVTECEPNKDSGTYFVTCKEICELLYRGVCVDPAGGWLAFLNPRVVIPTPVNGYDYKICDMLAQMLLGYYDAKEGYEYFKPGLGIDRSGLGQEVTLPGRPNTKISTQVLSGVSVGKGITDFMYLQCGFYIWYDYENKGALEYGFIRDRIHLDLTKEYIEKTVLKTSEEDEYVPDGVMVCDTTGIVGTAGECGKGKNIIVYSYNDTKIDTSLGAIAAGILEMNQFIGKQSYVVTFPAGTVRFKEGDYFSGLGDQTMSIKGNEVNMEWRSGDDADPLAKPDDSSWQIKELTITEKGTDVVVGPSYYSVLDIYKSTLSKTTSGIPAPTEDHVEELNEVIIGGSDE